MNIFLDLTGREVSAMKLFQSREEKFYAELIRLNNTKLLKYARKKTQDEFQAEDIVQDVWLTTWTKVNDVMNSANPVGWLMNTLKNHLKKYYEDIAETNKATEAFMISGEDAVYTGKFDDAPSFVSVLSPNELLIIRLKEQGYKHREIAEKLGLRPGTIDFKVSRIKDKISRFLDSENL
jgi:RNA polymerase sigma factor (sigma-70 family)